MDHSTNTDYCFLQEHISTAWSDTGLVCVCVCVALLQDIFILPMSDTIVVGFFSNLIPSDIEAGRYRYDANS